MWYWGVFMDKTTFAGAVHLLLMNAQSAAGLPSYIHAAYGGDFDRLAGAAASAMGDDTSQLVMSTIIRCSESWARYDPDEVARQAEGTFEGDAQIQAARSQETACALLPKGIVPANDGDPVRSAVPVLLVGGEADPQDPPPNIADAGVELPRSTTVVVPGHGHGVAHIGCMPGLITAFVNAGTAAALDVRCAANVPIPSFITWP